MWRWLLLLLLLLLGARLLLLLLLLRGTLWRRRLHWPRAVIVPKAIFVLPLRRNWRRRTGRGWCARALLQRGACCIFWWLKWAVWLSWQLYCAVMQLHW